MRCEAFDQRLSEAGADAISLDDDAAGHVASCLRCQAELARYRRLHSELASLGVNRRRSHPDGLLDEIILGLDRAVARRANVRRASCVACTVAATAGAVGAVVAYGRVRNRRLAA